MRNAVVVMFALILGGGAGSFADTDAATNEPLAAPRTSGGASLDDVLARRQTVRDFATTAIDRGDLAQLLWAAQGITHGTGRTAPSAGALYPIEVYAVDAVGVWRYLPERHALALVHAGDVAPRLARAAGGQAAVRGAPLRIVVTATFARSQAKYGARGERYATLEAGHVAQDVLLEATALGLGAASIGAFDDDDVRRVLGLGAEETPMYIIAIGHPR